MMLNFNDSSLRPEVLLILILVYTFPANLRLSAALMRVLNYSILFEECLLFDRPACDI